MGGATYGEDVFLEAAYVAETLEADLDYDAAIDPFDEEAEIRELARTRRIERTRALNELAGDLDYR